MRCCRYAAETGSNDGNPWAREMLIRFGWLWREKDNDNALIESVREVQHRVHEKHLGKLYASPAIWSGFIGIGGFHMQICDRLIRQG